MHNAHASNIFVEFGINPRHCYKINPFFNRYLGKVEFSTINVAIFLPLGKCDSRKLLPAGPTSSHFDSFFPCSTATPRYSRMSHKLFFTALQRPFYSPEIVVLTSVQPTSVHNGGMDSTKIFQARIQSENNYTLLNASKVQHRINYYITRYFLVWSKALNEGSSIRE